MCIKTTCICVGIFVLDRFLSEPIIYYFEWLIDCRANGLTNHRVASENVSAFTEIIVTAISFLVASKQLFLKSNIIFKHATVCKQFAAVRPQFCWWITYLICLFYVLISYISQSHMCIKCFKIKYKKGYLQFNVRYKYKTYYYFVFLME